MHKIIIIFIHDPIALDVIGNCDDWFLEKRLHADVGTDCFNSRGDDEKERNLRVL